MGLALSAVGKYTTYNGSAEAGEMDRSVRCLPHMHEDLSSIAVPTCNPGSGDGEGDRRTMELGSSGTLRSPVSY